MSSSRLFTPFRVGALQLRNRIVIAPMCQYSADDGRTTDWHLIHLGNLALSGAALLIIEATAVLPEGRITADDLGLWSDETEAALARTLASSAAIPTSRSPFSSPMPGARPPRVPWQGGAQIAPASQDGWQTVAPSAIAFADGENPPAALDREGLAAVRDAIRGRGGAGGAARPRCGSDPWCARLSDP